MLDSISIRFIFKFEVVVIPRGNGRAASIQTHSRLDAGDQLASQPYPGKLRSNPPRATFLRTAGRVWGMPERADERLPLGANALKGYSV